MLNYETTLQASEDKDVIITDLSVFLYFSGMSHADDSQGTHTLTEVLLHNFPPDAETLGPLKGGVENYSILQDRRP